MCSTAYSRRSAWGSERLDHRARFGERLLVLGRVSRSHELLRRPTQRALTGLRAPQRRLLDEPGQLHVACGDAARAMCPELYLHLPPAHGEIGMMVGRFREEPDRIHEHHPDLAVSWGKVQVKLWTHSAGGVTA